MFHSPQPQQKTNDFAKRLGGSGEDRCALKPHAPHNSRAWSSLFPEPVQKSAVVRLQDEYSDQRHRERGSCRCEPLQGAVGSVLREFSFGVAIRDGGAELTAKFITKDEAKQLSEAHPDWTRWILIPANEKDLMLQRINGRLAAEGIPEVEMIILKWRVSQLLRDIQRKYGTSCVSPPLSALSRRLHTRPACERS